jgi:hypothetical protein
VSELIIVVFIMAHFSAAPYYAFGTGTGNKLPNSFRKRQTHQVGV